MIYSLFLESEIIESKIKEPTKIRLGLILVTNKIKVPKTHKIMLKNKKQEEYHSPMADILEISGTGILCNSTSESESGTEGFETDTIYGW